MLCCLALGGLAIFGPHGVKLYRALTKGRRPAYRPAEPTASQHLVLATLVREGSQ